MRYIVFVIRIGKGHAAGAIKQGTVESDTHPAAERTLEDPCSN